MARDPFDEFFKRMTKRFFRDFEEIEKDFEIFRGLPKMPEFVVRRPGRVERRSGFSISISSDGVNPPKIDVRRFGPTGRWEKVPLEKGAIAPKAEEEPAIKILREHKEKIAPPKIRERIIPEYNVSVDIKEVAITLNAEGVESRGNVRVKFYPGSIEIYAVSPKLNKGYFCTAAMPASVDRQKTTIEVEKKRVIVRIPRQFSTA